MRLSSGRKLSVCLLVARNREFEKQSMQMDMTEEMIGDVIDNVMEGDEEEAETEELVQQVLDEIGIGVSEQVGLRSYCASSCCRSFL